MAGVAALALCSLSMRALLAFLMALSLSWSTTATAHVERLELQLSETLTLPARAKGYDAKESSHPSTGRFLSLDPVAGSLSDPLSTQGFTYVGGNPTRYTDPTGEFAFPVIAVELAAGGVLGGVIGGIVGVGDYLFRSEKITVDGLGNAGATGAIVGAGAGVAFASLGVLAPEAAAATATLLRALVVVQTGSAVRSQVLARTADEVDPQAIRDANADTFVAAAGIASILAGDAIAARAAKPKGSGPLVPDEILPPEPTPAGLDSRGPQKLLTDGGRGGQRRLTDGGRGGQRLLSPGEPSPPSEIAFTPEVAPNLPVFTPLGASEGLPLMRGYSVPRAMRTLRRAGFSLTHVSNSTARNQTWNHPDGSEVRVHPYGNQNIAPYRTANNGHIHKEDAAGNQLNDEGVPSTDPARTHIGIRNPRDLPQVRGRPHGTGVVP